VGLGSWSSGFGALFDLRVWGSIIGEMIGKKRIATLLWAGLLLVSCRWDGVETDPGDKLYNRCVRLVMKHCCVSCSPASTSFHSADIQLFVGIEGKIIAMIGHF
jgi:hypothetical protein